MHHDCTTRNPIKFSYLYIRFDSNANKMHCMYPTRKTQKLHSSLDNSRARVVETAPIVKMRIRSEMENQEGGKNNISLMWRRYKLLFFPPLFRDFWWQWCAEHNWRSNNKNNNSGKTPHHNPPQSKPHLYIDKIAFIVKCYLLILGFVAWTFFCYWLIGFSPLQPLHFWLCHFRTNNKNIWQLWFEWDTVEARLYSHNPIGFNQVMWKDFIFAVFRSKLFWFVCVIHRNSNWWATVCERRA